MHFRSLVVRSDRLPTTTQVVDFARQFGIDVRFDDGFDFRTNPKNRTGRVGIRLDGDYKEFGYAIDPLELLIDDHELPPELAEHGDVFVTFAVPGGLQKVIAAAERQFAILSEAHGWREDKLIQPDAVADEAEKLLASKGTQTSNA